MWAQDEPRTLPDVVVQSRQLGSSPPHIVLNVLIMRRGAVPSSDGGQWDKCRQSAAPGKGRAYCRVCQSVISSVTGCWGTGKHTLWFANFDVLSGTTRSMQIVCCTTRRTRRATSSSRSAWPGWAQCSPPRCASLQMREGRR